MENAFGIMAQRWRILRRPFTAKETNVKRIVAACVVLHNFMIKESAESAASYTTVHSTDRENWQGEVEQGEWRADPQPCNGFTPASSGAIRSTQYVGTYAM